MAHPFIGGRASRIRESGFRPVELGAVVCLWRAYWQIGLPHDIRKRIKDDKRGSVVQFDLDLNVALEPVAH
ncbi:hypothetical protein L0U95_12365 [Burkholderia cenocepacia]|uniref:hypothetical protein n=1 Tax=Burkholderia cenocepacia TaxID=95486 RepID=UPI001F481609|nr:hypothetical protein [Burkholderia cenocepacia]UJH72591.1 hypothetical protein L0U95_12365 [Burkholderia cenocepacia]